MNVERQKHIFVWVICGLVLTAALVAGGVWAVRHDRAMHGALRELQEWNLADTVFRSDSAAQVLVDYFDHPWHSANDQMLAHYLLGRAHADMGEAPQAIEAYQTAVECADTTDQDCDFRLLRNVWGQMAEVFDAQNLPEDELKADSMFIRYSWLIGDTFQAVSGYTSLLKPLFLLSDTAGMIRVSRKAKEMALFHGYKEEAAKANIGIIDIYIAKKDIERAEDGIRQIREKSGLFDKDGNLLPGREMFYYTIASYFEAVNQLDSAEYYYRQLLPAREYEAAYKGLLSVYGKRGIPDSIAKFAPLYADANDAYHDTLRTAEVHKTASLYNYNRHLRQAQVSEQKANRRLIVIYVAIIIILVLVIIGYILRSRYLEKERKREHALNTIRENYRKVNEAYLQFRNELESNKSDAERVKQELLDLQEQQEQLDLLASSLKQRNRIGYYYSHEIVQGLIDAAICSTRPPAGKLLLQLHSLFSETFPQFISFVQATHDLTDIEWYVCILMDLGLCNQDIAFLTGYSPSRISNIKVQISHNLFHEDCSITLLKNLRAQIHPIPSQV